MQTYERDFERVRIIEDVVITKPFNTDDAIAVNFAEIKTLGNGNCFYNAVNIGKGFLDCEDLEEKRVLMDYYLGCRREDMEVEKEQCETLRLCAATDPVALEHAKTRQFLLREQGIPSETGVEPGSLFTDAVKDRFTRMVKDREYAEEQDLYAVAVHLRLSICVLHFNAVKQLHEVLEWINPGHQALYVRLGGQHYTAMIPAGVNSSN